MRRVSLRYFSITYSRYRRYRLALSGSVSQGAALCVCQARGGNANHASHFVSVPSARRCSSGAAKLRRRQRGHDGTARHGRACGGEPCQGPDHRRERRGQRRGRAIYPQPLQPPAGAVRGGELRRRHRNAPRVGALRTRQRQLHRRLPRQARQAPARASRHAVSRRSRRDEPAHAGAAAAVSRERRDPGRRRRTNRRRVSTCAWSPPPIATWTSSSPPASSARTSCTGCASSTSTCRRSGSGPRTFRR